MERAKRTVEESPMDPYLKKRNELKKELFEKTIERAKRTVEKHCGSKPGGRRWLVACPENSYQNEEYEVRLLVLEGSPPKGCILADYASGIVKAFSASGWGLKPIGTSRAYKCKIENSHLRR